ncbi:MAG: hypothetical protein ACFB4I_18470 [Cyanophyceae cyanobacterium]
MKRLALIPALVIALSLSIGACSETGTEDPAETPETEVAPESEPVTPETEEAE